MKNSFRKAGTLAAVGAAAALAGGGLLVAPAAASDDVAVKSAPVEGAAYDEFALNLLKTDSAVVSVGKNAEGNIVVTHDKGKELSAETKATVAEYAANVSVSSGDALIAMAQNEIVGGAGYINEDESAVCSVGFSAWNQSGAPALLSAGHCGTPGQTVSRSTPADDDAPSKPTTPDQPAYTPSFLDDAPVGTFDFSIYGGPENSPEATDISGISITNDQLKAIPAVTDWTSYASGDLAASSSPVTAVGSPSVGQEIQKSGRTTGVTSSTVQEVGVWASVSGKFVYGFLSTGANGTVFGGDSGGSVYSGTTALGVVSGGNEEGSVLFSTDLVNALAQTPGYSVMLDLAEPVVTSPENNGHVQPGTAISGTGPAGLTLLVSRDGGSWAEVGIDGAGNWSFAAPNDPATYEYKLRVKDGGYNRSEIVTHTVVVDEKAVAPVQITAPANGSTVEGPNVAVQGTGEPGAKIALETATADGSGLAGETTVDEAGNWSIAISAPFGEITATANQTAGDKTSKASSTFTVAVPAPAITSPANGSTLTAQPTAITGTGVAGATVNVKLDGVELGEAVAGATVTADGIAALSATVGEDGSWAIAIDSSLALGAHEINATQTIDGVTSGANVSTFTLVEPSVPTPQPTDPGNGNGNNPGGLPATGADGGALLGTGIFGGALVLLAGAVLLIARMRRSAAE
ncbi:S1 family peptidase [Microbacterium resistens]|uniref:S1 family peptidase n=1 Tax=Microbacterium resistens TaxID=156977 RepID=UPI000834A983|nr:S1 family peptidase [Microbacterium resistens]